MPPGLLRAAYDARVMPRLARALLFVFRLPLQRAPRYRARLRRAVHCIIISSAARGTGAGT